VTGQTHQKKKRIYHRGHEEHEGGNERLKNLCLYLCDLCVLCGAKVFDAFALETVKACG
jgi:hypothetical protein